MSEGRRETEGEMRRQNILMCCWRKWGSLVIAMNIKHKHSFPFNNRTPKNRFCRNKSPNSWGAMGSNVYWGLFVEEKNEKQLNTHQNIVINLNQGIPHGH